MSALSSTSTLAEVKAAYFDNASYEEDASATKAAAFITACRFLLLKLPKRARHADRNEIELEPGQIRNELLAAKAWLAGQAGSGVRFASFESFRD